jgi:FlaA1/EpsC-like NDP-sugar epimerase
VGTIPELEEVARALRASHALITIANASGGEIRRIAEACRSANIQTKIIPGIYELVGGQVSLTRIRDVAIEDLLGREPVELDDAAIGAVVKGHAILISGAGGSIGAELCRQVCRYRPRQLIMVEKSENALFEIERELRGVLDDIDLVACIGDVADHPRMNGIFSQYRPEVVFHAAAHKHVPLMEANPGEAIKNNIFGTKQLADLAAEYGVKSFVMISTDKAVNPTSIMGATKRISEIYVQALSQSAKTQFVAVRFGNVLGSAGSVVPIFKKQIAAGGPVTVTHPDMRRYFMTIPEACQLVLQAGAMGEGGEIFILDMGEPVRIVDLARDVITLSGLVPDEDVMVEFSGVRPGEKLFEELSVDAEQADKTKHPKVFIGKISPHDYDEVARVLESLAAQIDCSSDAQLRALVRTLVPEYAVSPAPAPESAPPKNVIRLQTRS